MVKATRRARRSLGKREKSRRYRQFLGDVIRLHDKGYNAAAITTITGRSPALVARTLLALEKLEAEKMKAVEDVA